MKIIEEGHIYELSQLDVPPNSLGGVEPVILRFVNREEGHEHAGTQTQEVLRALIDRTMHCDNCLPWDGNVEIIKHLRMALVLHEARALERKTAKNYIDPEAIKTGPDGHFEIVETIDSAHKDSVNYSKRRGSASK
jgi:hypothetical protein